VSATKPAERRRRRERRPIERARLVPVLLMLATVILFPVSDAIAKLLTGALPVVEVVWGRLFFQSLVVAALAAAGGARLRTTRLPLQLGRALLFFANIVMMIAALSLLPLGTAITILFTFPIFVTALAVPLLGERIGAGRWAAVLIGFAGTIVIIRPGFPGSYLGVVLALAAALASAAFQIMTRRLASTEAPVATLLYTSVGGAVLASLAALPAWLPPSLGQWGLLALSGVLGGAVNWLVIKAFSYASPAVLAPLSYGEILGAALLGFLLFGEVPDARLASGAVLIIASGAWSAWMEATGRHPEPLPRSPTA
jgi:drug/metabolite transporter (DMT)-like permease